MPPASYICEFRNTSPLRRLNLLAVETREGQCRLKKTSDCQKKSPALLQGISSLRNLSLSPERLEAHLDGVACGIVCRDRVVGVAGLGSNCRQGAYITEERPHIDGEYHTGVGCQHRDAALYGTDAGRI